MQTLLPMSQAVNLMSEAFRLISNGEAVAPVRLNLPIKNRDANSLVMPCYIPSSHLFGIKIANVFPRNIGMSLPAINAFYYLYSAETGLLLAEMDGSMLTQVRTGAASGLATKLLADPDASVLAIFGTGVQAITQVEAVCCVRDIREIIVFGRGLEKSEKFAEMLTATGLSANVRAANSPSDLLQADIICTATPSVEPLFKASDVKPGAHINAIGAYRPDMCELPADLIVSCQLFVDEVEAAWDEAGDIIQPLQAGLIQKDHIVAELGEMLDASFLARRNPEGITVFKSVGSAVQDFVSAKFLYECMKK